MTETSAPLTEPSDTPAAQGQDLLVQEGDIAGDYLERLLDIADVDAISTWTLKASGPSWPSSARD